MIEGKSYIDYKFIGIRPFTELLTEAGTVFKIINDPALTSHLSGNSSILFCDSDTMVMGIAEKDGKQLYFLDFGIMIAPQINAHSYIVFIYDHYPEPGEIDNTINDIESLVNSHLDIVQKQFPQKSEDIN